MPASTDGFRFVFCPPRRTGYLVEIGADVTGYRAHRPQGTWTLEAELVTHLGAAVTFTELDGPFGSMLAWHSALGLTDPDEFRSRPNVGVGQVLAAFGAPQRARYGTYVVTGADENGRVVSMDEQQAHTFLCYVGLFLHPEMGNVADEGVVAWKVAELEAQGWLRVGPARAYPVYLRRGRARTSKLVRVTKDTFDLTRMPQAVVEEVDRAWVPSVRLPSPPPSRSSSSS